MKWLGRGAIAFLALLVGAFLIFRVPDTNAEEMRAKYGGEPSQFLELSDGQRVHLRDEGPRNAPVIVLLHGSNADLHTWQPWADRLIQDYRVIRFDQVGHGLTGPAVDDDYSLDAFASDVDEIATKLGVERFVLAGNSMGGWIAMGYAMAHPERLHGLVLVDAAGAPVEREGGGNLAFTLARMPVVGDAMSQMLPRALVARSLSQSVVNQKIVTDPAIDRYWELARYPGNRDATRKRFSAPREHFRPAQVAEVEVPTLIMWGEGDSLIPYRAAGWFLEHLPNATLVHYAGVGHIPQEEAPDRSVADLRAWMADLPAPKASAQVEPAETMPVHSG